MNFIKFLCVCFFKTLCCVLIVMLTVMGASKATEQAPVRVKALNFSQKAEEAAKRGDLEGVKEALGQVESLHKLPSMKKLIVGYSDVQKILGRTIQAVAEVYLKEAEEVYQKGEEERAKSILKQAEQIIQQLPNFIKGPITFSKPVQKRFNILKQDIAAKAETEVFKKEEAVEKRLVELEEENRQAAEIRKVQSTTARPVEQTDQSRFYREGQSLASSFMEGVTSSNPEIVPGYAGKNLSQSQIKAHDLGDEALRASQGSEASHLIADNFEKGERFVIDPHTDPLIVAGNQIIANPQKVLEETIVETEEGGGVTEEVKTCEEGGDEYKQSCSKLLQLQVKVTPQTGYYTPKWCIEHWKNKVLGTKYSCGGCRGGDYVITQHKKVDVKEKWIDGCSVLEELAEKGICRYISKTTSPKNETKTIEGEPFTREHFEEHFQYACLKTSGKSCTGLREKGCYQVKSACKEEIDGRCVLWEQTYRCPSYKMGGKSYRSSSKESPFCLSGDCADKSYEPNQDFAQVMSHMSVLKEAGADLRSFGAIFKGQDRRCTRHCVGFKDCCGNGKGWGVSLSLASCDADEKELAELRKKNRCIQVGTYCAEKVAGVCIRKKTSFCCYGTKLAKIVQEQGKRQLGLGFGSPKHPVCQGLTPEQLSRIDFSRINFSDIFSEIVTRTKTPNPEKLISGIQKSMENKGSLLKPSVKGTKEEPLILKTPSMAGVPSGNELPAKNSFKADNLQIQGHHHGEF